jgi:hypothetical protein
MCCVSWWAYLASVERTETQVCTDSTHKVAWCVSLNKFILKMFVRNSVMWCEAALFAKWTINASLYTGKLTVVYDTQNCVFVIPIHVQILDIACNVSRSNVWRGNFNISVFTFSSYEEPEAISRFQINFSIKKCTVSNYLYTKNCGIKPVFQILRIWTPSAYKI